MIPVTIADIIPITTTTLGGEAENLGQCLEEEEEDGIAFITMRKSRARVFSSDVGVRSKSKRRLLIDV